MFTRTSPSTGTGSPQVTGFYHEATGSIMYVAADPATRACALIDIVQDAPLAPIYVKSLAGDDAPVAVDALSSEFDDAT